jgi:hypothetical protein
MLEERPHLVATSTAEGACTARAIAALVRDPAVRGPDHLAARLIAPGLKLTTLIKLPLHERRASRRRRCKR